MSDTKKYINSLITLATAYTRNHSFCRMSQAHKKLALPCNSPKTENTEDRINCMHCIFEISHKKDVIKSLSNYIPVKEI